MTPIVFMSFYVVGLCATIFKHPIFGVYTYFFTFYMSPASSWWSTEVPELRYLLIIGVITFLRTLTLPQRDVASWFDSGFMKLFFFFASYVQIQYFWAVDTTTHINGMILFMKHGIFLYVLVRLVNTLKRLEGVIFANILGCFYYGYYALSKGGGRLEMFGGANEIANHVAAIGLMFTGMMFLGSKGIRRWICFFATPFILNCLVLTVSRGAFLGFFSGGLFGYVASPKVLKRQYLKLGVLAMILLAMLAHDALIERFQALYTGLTEEQSELDVSALSRLDVAKAGFQMGMDHPMGAGWRGTVVLSPYYIDQKFLSNTGGGRSAHNTLAAVFAEQGFPGTALYIGMLIWFWRAMVGIRRIAPRTGFEREIMLYRCMIGSAIIAFLVSGNFHNNLSQETPYWCFALLAALVRISETLFRQTSEGKQAAPNRQTEAPPHLLSATVSAELGPPSAER